MKIRNELHLQLKGNKLLKPHACYTLTLEDRREFCIFLKSVKFPDGYAANISRNVNISCKGPTPWPTPTRGGPTHRLSP